MSFNTVKWGGFHLLCRLVRKNWVTTHANSRHSDLRWWFVEGGRADGQQLSPCLLELRLRPGGCPVPQAHAWPLREVFAAGVTGIQGKCDSRLPGKYRTTVRGRGEGVPRVPFDPAFRRTLVLQEVGLEGLRVLGQGMVRVVGGTLEDSGLGTEAQPWHWLAVRPWAMCWPSLHLSLHLWLFLSVPHRLLHRFKSREREAQGWIKILRSWSFLKNEVAGTTWISDLWIYWYEKSFKVQT